MRSTKLGDSLLSVKDSYKEGLNELRSVIGQSGDRDLRLYNRMKPHDFAILSQKLGPNAIFDYIHDMELRRMREGKNG